MISAELSGIKIIGSSNTNSHSILDQIRHIVRAFQAGINLHCTIITTITGSTDLHLFY